MHGHLFNVRLTIFLSNLFLLLALAACSLGPRPATPDPLLEYRRLEPNPALSPEAVIKIQLGALQHNDSTDQGIEITFRFASPDNKRFTGPLQKFTRMINNPLYKPMLNHQSARYGPIEISGDHATQRVTVIDAKGQAITYVFSLSRQTKPPCMGCWMTDSVTVEPVNPKDHRQA